MKRIFLILFLVSISYGQQVDLGTQVKSTLPVANGGTGNTSLPIGTYVKGNGTSAVTTQAVPIPIADGGTAATTATGTSDQLQTIRIETGATARSLNAKNRDQAHVKDFGAVGDGVADDTTAWQNALNAVAGTTKVLRCDGGKYKITSSLSVTAGPFSLDGGGSCELDPVAASGTLYVFNFGGQSVANPTTATVGVNTTSRATQSTNTITVASVTGYSAGSYVLLQGTQNGNTFNQITRVRSIAGSVLTLWDSVIIPIQTTDTNSVQTTGILDGLTIRGVILDGINVTGTTTIGGIRSLGVVNGVLDRVITRNFAVGTNPNAILLSNWYNSSVSNLYSLNDGSGGSAAINISTVSNFTAANWNINSPAQIPIVVSGTRLSMSNINASGSVAGGGIFKTGATGYSNFTNINLSNNPSGNCLRITGGTYRTNWFGINLSGCQASEGLWLSGQDNIYNYFTGIQAIGNSPNDISFNSTDNFNTVLGVSRQAVLNDLGANNVIRLEGEAGRNFSYACSGTATANQTLQIQWAPPTTCTAVGTSSAGEQIISSNGVLRNLRVKAATGGVNASSGVVTVVQNGVATAITCTLGTGTTCTDKVRTINVVPGDGIIIRYTTQAAETLAELHASVEW